VIPFKKDLKIYFNIYFNARKVM